MANQFGILLKSINLEPNKVEKIVLATTTLHNIMKKQASDVYQPPETLKIWKNVPCLKVHGVRTHF